jgi:hypothetical protein
MDSVTIHQQYLLSRPGSYELLNKWHPIIHSDMVNHDYDATINSLILSSPFVPPPSFVYWYPEEALSCEKDFNFLETGDVYTCNYPLITNLEAKSDMDSLIELSPQNKVLYFPENVVLLPIQTFNILDSTWARQYVQRTPVRTYYLCAN